MSTPDSSDESQTESPPAVDGEGDASVLSNRQTARALRGFIVSGTFWGAWGRVVGIGTATFTGYALWLGASEAEIAYFVSVASCASLAQMLSSALVSRLRRIKSLLMLFGALEMLLRLSTVLVPPLFVPEEYRVLVLSALLGAGLVFGHLNAPIYSGWIAEILPPDIRARFTARKTNANLIAGVVAGYAAGYVMDLYPEADQYEGFWTLYTIATVLGIAGYLRLMTIPYVRQQPSDALSDNPLTAFRTPAFTRLAAFFLAWNFALGIAGPFYSVFMLSRLHISYSTVAIFNNIFLIAMVVGYRLMGGLVDRYGSKAVLNILVPPTLLTPILWTFNSPDTYWLIPVAMALNGLLHAGILTAVSALLYTTIPDDANKATYFAAWSMAVHLAYAVSPVVGSTLIALFKPYSFELFGFGIGNIQLVFLASSAAIVFPSILLGFVTDARSGSTRDLLAQLGRGNLFTFAYGSVVFDRSEGEDRRARAARLMGRSRNPMALDRLVEALDDASPEVRRQAARGLGEARDREAVAHLLDELRDEESDIRTEAAEALGKIGDPAVVEPLVEALDDEDGRIQISAIRALADIGGDEVAELLFWKFADGFDRAIFPTLAEALARNRDYRMVKPTLEWMSRYRSPAIRLQLLNSVTRTLGAGRRFYRMISMEPLERSERLTSLLERTNRAIRRSGLHRALKSHLSAHVDRINSHADRGDISGILEESTALTETLVDEIHRGELADLGPGAADRISAIVLAIRIFAREHATEKEEIVEVFLIVCLWALGDALSE